ncbi:60S ribosomal protein L28-1-like [Malus sylvestris]|uniref:60S ribosomal protein L28-1-like n=1 Tax=Malus sylvestris TaxID=3752 RepID=UPI0021ACE2FE|nr:60S ribosomal protein L28-1-like [Malus sylvestris]
MATVLGQLIWEIVKKNNSFLVKEYERSHVGVRFTKEPNNLLNLHSYKYSGLANKKTVTIQGVGKDQSVLLVTSKTKKQNKPVVLLHKSVMKQEFRRMAKAVANQFYAAVITFIMRESETVPVRRVCSTGDLDL